MEQPSAGTAAHTPVYSYLERLPSSLGLQAGPVRVGYSGGHWTIYQGFRRSVACVGLRGRPPLQILLDARPKRPTWACVQVTSHAIKNTYRHGDTTSRSFPLHDRSN